MALRQIVLDSILKRVTAEMNELLIAKFTSEEIEKALKQICFTKTIGPCLGKTLFRPFWST